MKDQRALANKCLINEIPFFTLCGNDKLARMTLSFYIQLAQQEQCNTEFVLDLKELLKDFEDFANQEPEKMKLPD